MRPKRPSAHLYGAACALLALLASPAQAALDRATISQAGFHTASGTPLPLEVAVTEHNSQTTLRRVLDGKPALLVFVDYQCRSLCGIVLDRLADVLPNVQSRLGQDYNVVALALDERQTQSDAIAFRDRHLGGKQLAALGHFVTEDRTARDAIERSVGLVTPYDAGHQRFVHPAGLVAIDSEGRLKAVLSPFALDPRDIEMVLADSGAPSSFAGHALQLCYGYNAVTGVYDIAIERILAAAAAVTLALMAAAMTTLLLIERRRARTST